MAYGRGFVSGRYLAVVLVPILWSTLINPSESAESSLVNADDSTHLSASVVIEILHPDGLATGRPSHKAAWHELESLLKLNRQVSTAARLRSLGYHR